VQRLAAAQLSHDLICEEICFVQKNVKMSEESFNDSFIGERDFDHVATKTR
jgi:hypothetical protein